MSPLERRLKPGFRIKIMSKDHHATNRKLRHGWIPQIEAAATGEEGHSLDPTGNRTNLSRFVESSRD